MVEGHGRGNLLSSSHSGSRGGHRGRGQVGGRVPKGTPPVCAIYPNLRKSQPMPVIPAMFLMPTFNIQNMPLWIQII